MQACWNDDLSPQRLGCAILVTIEAPANGVVSFNWAYETFDSPYFDAVGFVHDGVITLVADPNGAVVNGIFSANVLAGQTFGFWLDTAATAATAARGPGSATSRRRCPSRARWHWSRWASPLQA